MKCRPALLWAATALVLAAGCREKPASDEELRRKLRAARKRYQAQKQKQKQKQKQEKTEPAIDDQPIVVAVADLHAPPQAAWLGPALGSALSAKLERLEAVAVQDRHQLYTLALRPGNRRVTPALLNVDYLVGGSVSLTGEPAADNCGVEASLTVIPGPGCELDGDGGLQATGSLGELATLEQDLARQLCKRLRRRPEPAALAHREIATRKANMALGRGLCQWLAADTIIGRDWLPEQDDAVSITEFNPADDPELTARVCAQLEVAAETLRQAQTANGSRYCAAAQRYGAAVREALARLQTDPDQAEAVRRQTMELLAADGETWPAAFLELARLKRASGDLAGAAEAYRKYLRWLGRDADAAGAPAGREEILMKLIDCYVAQDEPDRAAAVLEELGGDGELGPQLRYTLMRACLKLGKTTTARNHAGVLHRELPADDRRAAEARRVLLSALQPLDHIPPDSRDTTLNQFDSVTVKWEERDGGRKLVLVGRNIFTWDKLWEIEVAASKRVRGHARCATIGPNLILFEPTCEWVDEFISGDGPCRVRAFDLRTGEPHATREFSRRQRLYPGYNEIEIDTGPVDWRARVPAVMVPIFPQADEDVIEVMHPQTLETLWQVEFPAFMRKYSAYPRVVRLHNDCRGVERPTADATTTETDERVLMADGEHGQINTCAVYNNRSLAIQLDRVTFAFFDVWHHRVHLQCRDIWSGKLLWERVVDRHPHCVSMLPYGNVLALSSTHGTSRYFISAQTGHDCKPPFNPVDLHRIWIDGTDYAAQIDAGAVMHRGWRDFLICGRLWYDGPVLLRSGKAAEYLVMDPHTQTIVCRNTIPGMARSNGEAHRAWINHSAVATQDRLNSHCTLFERRGFLTAVGWTEQLETNYKRNAAQGRDIHGNHWPPAEQWFQPSAAKRLAPATGTR